MSFQKLKSLNAVQQRRAASMLGAILADAATCPLHWIYDQEKVQSLTEEKNCIEFYPVCKCPYYTIEPGNTSFYGDQLYVTLKHIAENKGFDASKLADALFKHFGPGTVYEKARKEKDYPINGPYTNHSLKTFIGNREKGKTPEGNEENKDPDGLCKAIAVVGLLSGKKSLIESVTKCTKTLQLNSVAIDYAEGAVYLLDHMIQHGKDASEAGFEYACSQAKPDVVAAIKKAKDNTKPHKDAVKEFGLACPFPGSLEGMIHGVYNATDYVGAVRAEIKAAGDNCSRVVYTGAYCGAKFGLDGIPEEWLSKYKMGQEVLGYIQTIAEL